MHVCGLLGRDVADEVGDGELWDGGRVLLAVLGLGATVLEPDLHAAEGHADLVGELLVGGAARLGVHQEGALQGHQLGAGGLGAALHGVGVVLDGIEHGGQLWHLPLYTAAVNWDSAPVGLRSQASQSRAAHNGWVDWTDGRQCIRPFSHGAVACRHA